MMRRTVTVEVEVEGERPTANELRDAIDGLCWRYRWEVVRCEIVGEEDPRG
jgi:hypothetical protein